MPLLVLALGAMALQAGENLLANPGFEEGLNGWTVRHPWYEKPKGAGLSEITVAKGEGRGGSAALKIVGRRNRGIAMQNLPAFPGRYKVTGWVRCRDLAGAKAGILVEFLARDGKYISGTWAGQVTGTCDWTKIEAVIEAPEKARIIHFDLLTTEPNEGVAWFDDISIERLPSGFPTPAPPGLSASAPDGDEACLLVKWDPKRLSRGVVTMLIYCSDRPFRAVGRMVPRAVVDAEEGQVVLRELKNGRRYYVGAVAVNADGVAGKLSRLVSAVPRDRKPPRPGTLWAEWTSDGALQVRWWPHVLDLDVTEVQLFAVGPEGRRVELARKRPAQMPYPSPFMDSRGAVSVTVAADKLGFRPTAVEAVCRDRDGNVGKPAVARIVPAPKQAPVPADVWLAPPTEQVRRDAQAPQSPREIELYAMRGQFKTFQVVLRPRRALHNVRVRVLRPSARGGAELARRSTCHFVDYVHIEKNSRATPKDELVWPAPADYPDPLSDDLARDLQAGQAQPVMVRLWVPRQMTPGSYQVPVRIDCDEGSAEVSVRLRVARAELPAREELKFVYWFSWHAPCQRWGIEDFSEDCWRVLYRTGELMRAFHQNVVRVPWALVRTFKLPSGRIVHDFSRFDRFVETFMRAGVDRLFCISHIGARSTGEWMCPTMSSHRHRITVLPTGARAEMDAVDLLAAIQEHLKKRGWLNKFCVHVADEPIPVNVQSYCELAARVKKAAPLLPRIDAIHVPDLRGALEIWVPQLNYFNQWLDQYKKAQAEGYEIWFYVAWVPQGHYPNRMIDSHAIKPRILHWMNFIYDTSGYLHWALNHWRIPLTSLGSPGDQYICWPSDRFIANSSLRYEAEREGLEDCQLMFMLRQALQRRGLSRKQAHERVARIARRAVRDFEDFTKSWWELEAVRAELLRRLDELVGR